jgi:hypothetical protein
MCWNNNEMPDPGLDPRITPGAHVRLARLISLDRVDNLVSGACAVVVRLGIHVVKSIPKTVLRCSSVEVAHSW